MNIFKRIEKWNKDRLLDKQEFNSGNEIVNIAEELFESLGYDIPKRKRRYLRMMVLGYMKEIADELNVDYKKPTKQDIIDAYCDIIVFATGALLKLGVDPECAMEETLKEIESRTGSIIDGKFQKDTSEEAKSKWYKADYDKCIKGE